MVEEAADETLPELPAAAAAKFGVKLASVRVFRFRSLADVDVPIADRVTLLIGENNSGKTSFLDALAVAFGNRRPSNDDLHVNNAGVRDSVATIVLRFEPTGADFSDNFASAFGDAVRLPPEPGFVALRTKISYAGDDKEPEVARDFIKEWPSAAQDPAAIESTNIRFGPELRKYLMFDYIDARRDILEEIRNKKSYWGRLLAETEIPAASRTRLSAELEKLGNELKAASPTLTELTSTMAGIATALGAHETKVELEPLPRRVDDLVRSVDVSVQTPGASAFSVGGQGMGTRSLAAIFAFQAYVNGRRAKSAPENCASVATFEEPESHLHPHAQRQIFRVLSSISGQTIVSTHSVHLVGVGALEDFRVFRRSGASTIVRCVDAVKLRKVENASIVRRKLAENPDTLFARAVGIVEGQTESEALPILGRHRWSPHGPDIHGISISLLRGVGSAPAMVVVLEGFGIPWICLVDNDDAGSRALESLSKTLGRTFTRESKEIVTFAEGRWEEHVWHNVPRETIAEAVNDWLTKPGAEAGDEDTRPLETRRKQLHGTKASDGSQRDYEGAEGRERFLRDQLNEGKAKLAPALATRLCSSSAALPGVECFFARLEARATGRSS